MHVLQLTTTMMAMNMSIYPMIMGPTASSLARCWSQTLANTMLLNKMATLQLVLAAVAHTAALRYTGTL